MHVISMLREMYFRVHTLQKPAVISDGCADKVVPRPVPGVRVHKIIALALPCFRTKKLDYAARRAR